MTLFWLFDERHASVLGTSTLTRYAKKPWQSAFRTALKIPELSARMGENPERKAIRKAAGEEEWWTADDCHYAIAASNAEGGRSMSNKRVIADEFGKQYNYDAYGAAYYSMDAFEDAQYWGLTTPDPKGVPYNDLRGAALAFMESGVGDPSLGLFEWSAPVDADPTDLQALAMANPTLGRPGGKSPERLLNEARAAVAKGGELLRTFKTEILCIQAELLDPAIDPDAWKNCKDVGTLDSVRAKLAACVDLTPDGKHATLAVAAVLADGRVRVETVHEWAGPDAASQMERDLPGWVEKLKPKVVGWFPAGPAAAVAAKLADRRKEGVTGWPPRGVTVAEIRGETTAVCMGFAKEVTARTLAHSGQDMLDAQVGGTEKLRRGDGWVFTRSDDRPADAVYATAGAVHLARTLPAAVGKPRLIVAP
ncbi:terminase [Micromonospora noduli]|uniref:terminase n=1 Tax=Micromonospora noduli TaxID=709876 RepID=UPI001CED98B0|nr:terminase [Micromonospora noduli]